MTYDSAYLISYNVLSFDEKHKFIMPYLLTHSMEQSPSWEANRFVASQEIPRILLNSKAH
jgi:hypothetical protein